MDGGDFDMVTGKRQLHDALLFRPYLLESILELLRRWPLALRSLEGARPSASRYLATVRRATGMPSPREQLGDAAVATADCRRLPRVISF